MGRNRKASPEFPDEAGHYGLYGGIENRTQEERNEWVRRGTRTRNRAFGSLIESKLIEAARAATKSQGVRVPRAQVTNNLCG